VKAFVQEERITERPMLKDIIDYLIEDVQGARLREEVLPLDRYAQTELIAGRTEVSINSRIREIPGVRHVTGIVYVAKWHESIHVARDFPALGKAQEVAQPTLPGVEAELPQLVACRGFNEGLQGESRGREFFAENAGIAAAICGEDLRRTPTYASFMNRAADGGDLGTSGWDQLYRTAEFIGVNPSALLTYFQHTGLLRVAEVPQRPRSRRHDELIAAGLSADARVVLDGEDKVPVHDDGLWGGCVDEAVDWLSDKRVDPGRQGNGEMTAGVAHGLGHLASVLVGELEHRVGHGARRAARVRRYLFDRARRGRDNDARYDVKGGCR
jgi:hypothetical protein